MSDTMAQGSFVEEMEFEGEEEGEEELPELEEARRVIEAGQSSADKLLKASHELEQMVFQMVDVEEKAFAGAEDSLHLARMMLGEHRLFSASMQVKKAEKRLRQLEKEVKQLRRNVALLHRLLKEKSLTEIEVESLLRVLKKVSDDASSGDVGPAARSVQDVVTDLADGDTTTLNPFLFRKFWLGVEARWPPGGDDGLLLVRLQNDGERPLPPMRLSAPAPEDWVAEPDWVDIPRLPPGGFIHLKFRLLPPTPRDEGIPLARKLSVVTGYSVNQGEVAATVRLHNISMEPLNDILVSPWVPLGFKAENLANVARLKPDEVAHVTIPLDIIYRFGGEEGDT